MSEFKKYELDKILEKIIDFRGKTPLKIGMDWGNGTIPALSANNVEMGRINFKKECYLGSEELYKKWMKKGDCYKGDIVFTMEAPLGNVAIIPDNKKYILSQRVVLLKLNEKVSSYYIYQYLQSALFQKILNKYASGTTAKGIQQSKLLTLPIECPDLQEQQKIAEILTTVDNAIEKTEQIIDKYKNIKTGMMQDLFTRGIDENGKLRPTYEQAPELYKETELGWIPKDWKIDTLASFTQFIKDGTHGTHKDVQNGIPLLSAKDIREEKVFIEEDCRKISLNDYKQIHKNYELELGDILLTIVGTIGRTAIINEINKKFTLQRSVAIIRLQNKKLVKYFYHLICYENSQKQLNDAVNASAQGGVYLGSLSKLLLTVPKNESEAVEVSLKISAIDVKLKKEETHLEKLKQIKLGLMQDLLTGKVRVKLEQEAIA